MSGLVPLSSTGLQEIAEYTGLVVLGDRIDFTINGVEYRFTENPSGLVYSAKFPDSICEWVHLKDLHRATLRNWLRGFFGQGFIKQKGEKVVNTKVSNRQYRHRHSEKERKRDMNKFNKADLIILLTMVIAALEAHDEDQEPSPPAKAKAKAKVKKGARSKPAEDEDEDEDEDRSEKTVTLNQLRKVVRSAAAEHGKPAIKDLLKDYDVSTLSALEEEDYASFLCDLKELDD